MNGIIYRNYTILFLLPLTLLGNACTKSQSPQEATSDAPAVLTNRQFSTLSAEQLNSIGSVLSELAALQWTKEATNAKPIILSLHTNSFEVMKYTDGKYVIVSIPVINPQDTEEFCIYVNDYNQFYINQANSLARSGKYEEAEELYKLVIHFNPWGMGNDLLSNQLLLLDRLRQQPDVVENRQKFLDSAQDTTNITPWSEVTDAEPKLVTNLMNIPVKVIMRADEW
jgi:hypothetical protein